MIERDCFEYLKRPLFSVVEDRGNRVIRPRNSRCMPQLAGVIPWLSHPPARQPGDMACLESDTNHLSPLLPRCQLEAERAGILMDAHVRPGQLSLLLNRPAGVATRRVFAIPWAPVSCTRVETWTSYRGETARTNRAEAWISYRGEGWENKQDRGLDITQGGRLREETGEKLGHHTGREAARTYRVGTGTFHRG